MHDIACLEIDIPVVNKSKSSVTTGNMTFTLISSSHGVYNLKAYRLSELIFFLLKVANIRCFILIAVEIFHNIICKQPRTKEIRRCLIFLYPVTF